MNKEYFYFDSAFTGKKIHAVIYLPEKDETKINGFIQIIHGFAEHIGRYDFLMRLLADNGYVVFGDDHLGHGLTAKENHMKLTDVGSYEAFSYILKDEWQLNQYVRQKFNRSKYFERTAGNAVSQDASPCYILGHSMGSLMLRALLIQYPDICERAVIMGTGDMKPALLKIFKCLLNLAEIFHQGDYNSKFINALGIDNNNASFKSENSPYAWLSANSENVEKYTNDPFCGNAGSLHTFHFLQQLMSFIRNKDNLAKMNKDVPILLVSGKEDAFGEFGKGPEKVRDLLTQAGLKHIKLILYPDMRHEILNEKNNQIVIQDILNFFSA